MGIHQSTSVQAYQLNKGGSRARLAILRMIAAESVHNANPSTRLQPGDWKGARNFTLKGYEAAFGTLNQGANGKQPVWYSHQGGDFRDERDSHEILGGRHHTGWFTDEDCSDTAIGIVCRLTHGRMIAGYRWTSNDERVYFPEVFTDEREAAQMADEHARVFAESAREHSERFNAMQDAETAEETAREEVCKAWGVYRAAWAAALKTPAHTMAAVHMREWVRQSIEALREARDALADATKAYERG
jgi:hypothetical protein